MKSRFPDFYLAGVPKAGTSSLYEYFSQHPQLFVPAVKEPHFFACPEVEETYYKADFIRDETRYLALFRASKNNQLCGDCSPSYLFSSHASQRIHTKRPDAKIIVVLRNPIERAISHYLMDHRAGYQLPPLIDCLREPDTYSLFYKEYVEVGRYMPQLERFYQQFNKEQIKVYFYEDLKADTEATVRSMFRFLGVAEDARVEFSGRNNVAAQHRFAVLDKIVMMPWWPIVRKWLPRRTLSTLQSLFWNPQSKPDFSLEREWLFEAFSSDILALEQLTGRNLSAWRAVNSCE